MPTSDLPPARTDFDRLEFARTPVSQHALEQFRQQRHVVLLCVLLGALSVSRSTSSSGHLLFTLGLAFLALAIVIELGARAWLVRILSSEARHCGVSESTANFQAEAFLGRILAE